MGPTKALPWQHMVNVIAGVLLGPGWAAGLALTVGIVRMAVGLGTIYSIPGGVPGALPVGLGSIVLRRLGKNPILAGLLEPLGTAVIGFLTAYYVFAPIMGDLEAWRAALAVIWMGWVVSTAIGTALGVVSLIVLERTGVARLRPSNHR